MVREGVVRVEWPGGDHNQVRKNSMLANNTNNYDDDNDDASNNNDNDDNNDNNDNNDNTDNMHIAYNKIRANNYTFHHNSFIAVDE